MMTLLPNVRADLGPVTRALTRDVLAPQAEAATPGRVSRAVVAALGAVMLVLNVRMIQAYD
jgi:hypothetical protein